MNKKLKLLLAMLTVTTALGVASACSDSSSSSSEPTSSSSSPAPQKEKYEVKFVNDDNTLLSNEKVEEGVIPEAPANPTKTEDTWYTYAFKGWDKELTAVEDDVIYKATYTATKKTHTVVFKVDGEEVASKTYDVDTAKDSITPDVSAYDTVADQDVAWEEFELDGVANKVVNAVRTDTQYTIAFTHPRTGMSVLAPMTYTVQGKDSFVFPEIPAEFETVGYTTVWSIMDDNAYRPVTKADLVSNGITVSPIATANTYKVTFNANGGTATDDEENFVYDSEYTLPTATPAKGYQEFLGWYDEENNLVESGEAWNIAKNVTLTAKYSAGITFNTMTSVPSYFTAADTTASLSITDLNGNKVLEIKSNGGSPGMDVTRDALAVFFEDSNVDYIAFDAKTGVSKTDNFRRHTWRSNNGGEYVNVKYDADNEHTGINCDAWKTFFFSRADYNHWLDEGTTKNRIIATGGITSGDSIYIDNIRPATQAEYKASWYSFESASVRTNNGNQPLFYMGTESGWQLGISNIDSTTAKFTNEIVSDGMRAFTFKKKAGESQIILNHTADPTMETEMRNAGYISYDLYVPEDSNASAVRDNGSGVYEPLKQGWNTLYAKVDGTDNTVCVFWDSTASTYVLDNIRLLTAEEYNTEMLSFEGKAGVVRDSLLSDHTTYVYTPRDVLEGRWTLSVGEGKDSQGNYTCTITDPRFDTEIVKDGKQSFAFNKTNGYISLSLNTGGEMYALLKKGFTFWIYSTVGINGTSTSNFINGANNKFNGGDGVNITAGQWTQVTVTENDINGSGRFLIIQGSTAGTYYLDGFTPLPADAE